jgi:guanylate kinase
LFALDGASGAGKTTLALALLKAHPDLVLIPRYTTRQMRECESDRLEYKFVTGEQFARMIEQAAFIEYRCFEFGASYGLPWREADAILKAGKNALGIMNLGNVQQLRKNCPHAVAILIEASLKTLQRRLIERGTNTAEQITGRLANARLVDKMRPLYDEIVPNDGEFDITLSRLSGVIGARITGKHSI